VPAYRKFVWDQVSVPYYSAKENIDVLFHPKMSVPLFTNRKTVMVLHGSERFVFPEFSHKSDILYTKVLYPLYLKKASSLISVSENARKDIIRLMKIDPEKIKTIYLAPAKHFTQLDDPEMLASIKRKYSLPDRFLLNVGLIYPGKNIPNLLKAFKLVRREIDTKLVLAGSGRRMYKNDLNMINELGLKEHVLMPGYIPQEDLVAVYNLAEVVAFPSFYESFGLISVEANACGCPVVVSRTGGAPEAAGDAALYVDPTDEVGIGKAILRVLTDAELRNNLIEKGLQNAKRFSWEKTARQTLDVLESVGQS